MQPSQRIVIVGGGFAGLHAARSLARANAEIVLLDRRNFHLFQPLLYQVATGALSPANIAAPLRAVLRKQANTRVLLAEVVDFDVRGRRVILTDDELSYDTLIVASGSSFNYFGHDEWRRDAPGLKTVEDAITLRRRVLTAFERAERESDPRKRRVLLTFVIVGGGPTGVEMAGSLADMAHHSLRKDFRSIDPADARIILVEGLPRLLNAFPEKLSTSAADALRKLGVELITSATVTDVRPDGVTVKIGDETQSIDSQTLMWTAGVKASPLGLALSRACGVEADRGGRLKVQPDLTLPRYPEIFVVGDLAHSLDRDGKPLPGLAPVAMQQGRYVANVILRRLQRDDAPPPFRYHDKGTMATIGRGAAVADLGWTQMTGYPAWLAWLFIHLLYIVEFHNRILVLFQWAWAYITRDRSARLITEAPVDYVPNVESPAIQNKAAPHWQAATTPASTKT